MTRSADVPIRAPLLGWRVLVTRAREQAAALSSALRRLGATVVEAPTISIRPPHSFDNLDRALANLGNYDWLILTSANGAQALFSRMRQRRIPVAGLRRLRVATIGPATRQAAERRGLRVTVMPRQYVAESVVRALRNRVKGKRVLLVRAAVARDVLPNQLRSAGATVDVAEAYQTAVPPSSKAGLRRVFQGRARRPQIITFTSPSTASNFAALLGSDLNHAVKEVALASIGPVTSSRLRELGLPVAIEAREFTIPGLVRAIAQYARKLTTETQRHRGK